MSFKVLALAGLLSLAAAPAFADGALTASLGQPVAKPTQVVAGGAVWDCRGSSCQTGAALERTFTVSGCGALAKEVGPVTGFGGGRDALKADELAKCNAHAAHSQTQTASTR